jgi:hypothetical protein
MAVSFPRENSTGLITIFKSGGSIIFFEVLPNSSGEDRWLNGTHINSDLPELDRANSIFTTN